MAQPNPTQTRGDDAIILRRELKQLLPSDIALDREELRELLDLSNVGGRYDVLRLKLLRRALGSIAPDDVLRDDQFRALLDYREGRVPRPSFARYVTRDGHFIGESIAPEEPLRPQAAAPLPARDPDDHGRYVQPKGRFARSDESTFEPDSR